MNRKIVAIASLLLVAAMAAVSTAVGLQLPDELRLPVHWGLSGEPDRWAGKWTGLLMPAGMTAALSLLFWFLPSLESRGRNLLRSQGLYLWAWAAILLLGVAIQLLVLSTALDWGIPASRLMVGTLGLVLVLIGNQLGKSRSMYMIGLRTPWTLASEEVWIKTHRLAGKLMALAGLAALAAALLPLAPAVPGTVLAAGVAVAVVIPTVYSFLLWRREKKTGPAEE